MHREKASVPKASRQANECLKPRGPAPESAARLEHQEPRRGVWWAGPGRPGQGGRAGRAPESTRRVSRRPCRGGAPPYLLDGPCARHSGQPHVVARLPAQNLELLPVDFHLERVGVGPGPAAPRSRRGPGGLGARRGRPGLPHDLLSPHPKAPDSARPGRPGGGKPTAHDSRRKAGPFRKHVRGPGHRPRPRVAITEPETSTRIRLSLLACGLSDYNSQQATLGRRAASALRGAFWEL